MPMHSAPANSLVFAKKARARAMLVLQGREEEPPGIMVDGESTKFSIVRSKLKSFSFVTVTILVTVLVLTFVAFGGNGDNDAASTAASNLRTPSSNTELGDEIYVETIEYKDGNVATMDSQEIATNYNDDNPNTIDSQEIATNYNDDNPNTIDSQETVTNYNDDNPNNIDNQETVTNYNDDNFVDDDDPFKSKEELYGEEKEDVDDEGDNDEDTKTESYTSQFLDNSNVQPNDDTYNESFSPDNFCTDDGNFRMHNNATKSCAWVGEKHTSSRCDHTKVMAHCRATCQPSCAQMNSRFDDPSRQESGDDDDDVECIDDPDFRYHGVEEKSCEWAGKAYTAKRCKKTGFAESCRATCHTDCATMAPTETTSIAGSTDSPTMSPTENIVSI